MAFEVRRVRSVRRVVEKELSKRERQDYDAAVADLKGRGCRAGGHRLADVTGGDYPLCARHLYGEWRMFTAYPDSATVVIVAVDRHTESSNPAGKLSEVFPGLSPTGRRRSDKPPCCDDPSKPPQVSPALREALPNVFA